MSINAGKRRTEPKIVSLKEEGKRVLREEDVDIEKRGKGALEYRFWQDKITQHSEKEGPNTKIEHDVNGKE